MSQHDEDLDLIPTVEREQLDERRGSGDRRTTGNSPAEGADPMVDHPAHYNMHPAGIECIDVIEPMSFNIGMSIRYMWRHGLKPGAAALQDLDKAVWYLQREIQRLSA